MGEEAAAAAPRRPQKRLIFDRRYGWIVDEWRDPSQQALAAARGMFCVLPIATTVLKVASKSVDYAADSVVKVLENPDQFSQIMRANVEAQFQKLQNTLNTVNFKLPTGRSDSNRSLSQGSSSTIVP